MSDHQPVKILPRKKLPSARPIEKWVSFNKKKIHLKGDFIINDNSW